MAIATTPRRVRRAVALLWASLALSVVQMLLDAEFATLADEDGFAAVFWTLVIGSTAFVGVLIHFIGRGRRWARTLMLLVTVVGTVLLVLPWDEQDYLAGWTVASFVSTLALTLMDAAALYWLYTGEAKDWFRRPAG